MWTSTQKLDVSWASTAPREPQNPPPPRGEAGRAEARSEPWSPRTRAPARASAQAVQTPEGGAQLAGLAFACDGSTVYAARDSGLGGDGRGEEACAAAKGLVAARVDSASRRAVGSAERIMA